MHSFTCKYLLNNVLIIVKYELLDSAYTHGILKLSMYLVTSDDSHPIVDPSH
jgi:hypothetical protein